MIHWKEFQFPSNGKAYPKSLRKIINHTVYLTKFQFPSNGKAYPKLSADDCRELLQPEFQFPSNGKAYPKEDPRKYVVGEALSFNSLQTGKRIQRRKARVTRANPTFQFPSNGKAYPKGFKMFQKIRAVSIPFKRESVSKVVLSTTYSKNLSFNSLQTGKRIQRALWSQEITETVACFNSLQTGKRIQSKKDDRKCSLT